MKIWALADLHLSFGIEGKEMDVFGPEWEDFSKKIESNWRAVVADEDLVLVPGDISWAMHLEDALPDLEWIHALPGSKMILKGNHDYWWTSLSKMNKLMPPSIQILHNNALVWNDVAIAGSRLWDTQEFGFNEYINFTENPAISGTPAENKYTEQEKKKFLDKQEKIFERELQRLELSLKAMDASAKTRIAMTHYPPLGADLSPTRASALLEKYQIEVCVFGHLHSVRKEMPMFGEARGVQYVLTACDYVNFTPVLVKPTIAP